MISFNVTSRDFHDIDQRIRSNLPSKYHALFRSDGYEGIMCYVNNELGIKMYRNEENGFITYELEEDQLTFLKLKFENKIDPESKQRW
jgi:DNA-binding transcriptional regulator/RsmH inhibitor MraZ